MLPLITAFLSEKIIQYLIIKLFMTDFAFRSVIDRSAYTQTTWVEVHGGFNIHIYRLHIIYVHIESVILFANTNIRAHTCVHI